MAQHIEHIEHIVVGAGPAGLRAAQVLAEAGREVLVLERQPDVGPKTCAGGLSGKAVRELAGLGLPGDEGLTLLGHASFYGEAPIALHPAHASVRTLSRRSLGRWQAGWARDAGAQIQVASAVAEIDLDKRTLRAGDRLVRYSRLIGADGSKSLVRRALRLPSPRVYFAAEYNVPNVRLPRLFVEFDSRMLENGYFWVFPHEHYTSIGAGGHTGRVAPRTIRPYLDRRLETLGVDPGDTPYEGATIEVKFAGFDFPGGVHLAGDAAGVPSGLTGEGIYAALVTGEELARRLLEPGYPSPKTRAWLRVKRLHDAIGWLWSRRRPRDVSLAVLRRAVRWRATSRPLTAFFLEG